MRCPHCSADRESDHYHCLKVRSGLYNYGYNPSGLAEEEQLLIGLLPKAGEIDPLIDERMSELITDEERYLAALPVDAAAYKPARSRSRR